MGLQCCFGGLKLASSIPPSSYYSSSILTPLPKALALLLHRRRPSPRPPLPLTVRALSSPAIRPSTFPDDKVVKPQWKASIDFKWIRDNKETMAANIENRNSSANLELVLELYEKVLTVQKEVEQLRAERNVVANKMKGKLEPTERQKLIEEGKNLKDGLVSLEEDLLKLTDKLQQEAQRIPNMSHPDVPVGGEDCFVLRKMVGSPRVFGFPIKDHLQLGKDLDLIDFDTAAEGFLLQNEEQIELNRTNRRTMTHQDMETDRQEESVIPPPTVKQPSMRCESSANSSQLLHTPQVKNDLIPKINQEFDSLKKVKEFYNRYAKEGGFGTRSHFLTVVLVAWSLQVHC